MDNILPPNDCELINLESYQDISIRQLELDEWHPDSNI